MKDPSFCLANTWMVRVMAILHIAWAEQHVEHAVINIVRCLNSPARVPADLSVADTQARRWRCLA